MISEEHLQDIVSSPRWREHFSTLSRTLGFSLGIFSERGAPIVPFSAPSPFCLPLQKAGRGASECPAQCRAAALDALASAQPRWYTCLAGVMNFALPLSYFNDRAVIVGQGSIPSYENYRAYLDLLRSQAPEAAFPVSSTLRFTTEEDAKTACMLIDRSVNLFLRTSEETRSLKQKVTNLKELVSAWWGMSAMDAELVRENLVRNLMTMIEIRQAAVLVRDRARGAYVPSHRASAGGPDRPIHELRADGPVISALQHGQSFSITDIDSSAAAPSARYNFPIWVQSVLENVLVIDDGRLSDQDLHTILSLCKQVGLIIENKRLQHDLSLKFSRIATVAELSREISSISSYEALLRSILDQSAKLLMAEQGSLMLLDKETDALLLEVTMGGRAATGEKVRIPRGTGIAGMVVQDGEAILIENVESDPRIKQKNRDHYKTPSCLSVPLKIGDRIIGVLNFADKATGEVFDRDDLHLIQSFATHAAVVLERSVLHNQTEQLKKLSITDSLTGLLNRRYFQERLEEEVARTQRHGRPMTMLMLDVDGFKRYNDTFGHLAGDEVLRLVGETLLRLLRHMDIVARFGGDEFVVILPETATPGAVQIADRIRQEVANAVTTVRQQTAPTVTVSIGVAGYHDPGESAEDLLERADQALYRAKAGGRNRVEVHS